jgi:hypothetical protein
MWETHTIFSRTMGIKNFRMRLHDVVICRCGEIQTSPAAKSPFRCVGGRACGHDQGMECDSPGRGLPRSSRLEVPISVPHFIFVGSFNQLTSQE